MKKILITGANSYIGTSFENYIKKNAPEYWIETLDMKNKKWYQKSFKDFDTVFHVAGIAHADTGKVSDEKKAMYYAINRDLAVETAKKAKNEGVGQFIYMSSAIVFGSSAPIGKKKIVDADTKPQPANFYGDSKLQAEESLLKLQCNEFKVVILRPPMIYGKGSKGNYPVLSKLAQKLLIFPAANNQRSVLYIENLCEFVRLMIQNEETGIFHPQNEEYIDTATLVKIIAKAHKKTIYIVNGFDWALKFFTMFTGLVNKAFGSFCYDKHLSEYKKNYQVCSLVESIERTES